MIKPELPLNAPSQQSAEHANRTLHLGILMHRIGKTVQNAGLLARTCGR